jgi:hypothetical protein
MPIAYKGQAFFNGGEITPELGERPDLERYKSSVKTMKNFLCRVFGGAANRPGFEFIGRVLNDTKDYRCIPFKFSTTQTYCLVFGDQNMVVVKDGGLVLNANKDIVSITKTNPAVVEITDHGYSDGDFWYCNDGGEMTELEGKFYKIKNKTTDTFELTDLDGDDIDSTSFTTYSSGGTGATLYVLVTPYLEEDLYNIDYTQSADTLTIACTSYDVKELTRTDHNAWTITDILFLPQISTPSGSSAAHSHSGSTTWYYQITALDEDTLEESLPESITAVGSSTLSSTYTITISIAEVTDASKYNIYRLKNSVYGYIGSSNSAGTGVFVDDNIDPDLTDNPPGAKDPLAETDNDPAAVIYHKQRRIFGGSDANPNTHYGTQLGNYYNMNVSSTVKDTDAYTLALASNTVNRIRYFVSMRDLVILTNDSTWAVRPGSDSAVITGTAEQVQQSELGSAKVKPIVAIDLILFVEEGGGKIYDMGYVYNADQYSGTELSLLASHLFQGYTITDWCFAKKPFSIAWCVRDDGIMLGLTYLKQEEVVGWHQHETDGEFESVASVQEGQEDAVYAIIKRTINGTERKYIERMHSRFFLPNVEDAFFVDSGLTLDTWNTDSTSEMTLTGGTDWTVDEELTLTENGILSPFVTGDVGKIFIIRVFNTDGTINKRVKLQVISYISETIVTVKAKTLVATELRSVATTYWARAVTELTGLDHLEGKTISILADGNVLPQKVVVDGTVDLEKSYAKVHAGLPYTSLIELLDIDIEELGVQTYSKRKSVSEVDVSYVNSRGGFLANDIDSTFYEIVQRKVSDADYPIPLQTGRKRIAINPQTETVGNLVFKQEDPLPITITSFRPKVNLPRNDT